MCHSYLHHGAGDVCIKDAPVLLHEKIIDCVETILEIKNIRSTVGSDVPFNVL